MNQPLATTKQPSTALEEPRALGPWQVLTIAPGISFVGTVLFPNQVHGGNIVRAEELRQLAVQADGVVITEPDVIVGVVTADCTPVVIASESTAVLLHVSRKTLVRGLLDNALTHLSPAAIDHIFIGPHICEYHFGFQEEGELVRQFRYRYPRAVHFHKGLQYLSLRKALMETFTRWDIHPGKVTEDGRCTFEHLDLPSWRRELGDGSSDKAKLQPLKTVVWRPRSD